MGGYPRGYGNHTQIVAIALFCRALAIFASRESLLTLLHFISITFTIARSHSPNAHASPAAAISPARTLTANNTPDASASQRSQPVGLGPRAPAGAMSPPALLPPKPPFLVFGETRLAEGGISGGVGEWSIASGWSMCIAGQRPGANTRGSRTPTTTRSPHVDDRALALHDARGRRLLRLQDDGRPAQGGARRTHPTCRSKRWTRHAHVVARVARCVPPRPTTRCYGPARTLRCASRRRRP